MKYPKIKKVDDLNQPAEMLFATGFLIRIKLFCSTLLKDDLTLQASADVKNQLANIIKRDEDDYDLFVAKIGRKKTLELIESLFKKAHELEVLDQIINHGKVYIQYAKYKKDDVCYFVTPGFEDDPEEWQDTMIIAGEATWNTYGKGYWEYPIKNKANKCPEGLLKLRTKK